MSTIIDELIVKLNLDATGLRQGQTTAAGAMRQLQETFRRYSADIQQSTSAVGVSVSALRLGYEAVAIAALAAFAKVEQFATKVAAQNVTLAANAAAVRETTAEYSALGRALEAAIPGGGAGFARTVQNITSAIAETRYTGKPTGIAQAAITFGLPLTEESVDTATGLVRRHYIDAEKLAFNFIDKLKAQGKDYADAVWWAERYGVDRTLVYMRYKLTEEQQRQISAQQRMNALTQEQADASQRIWIAWQGLEGTLGRLDNVLLTKFEKQISSIIGYATSFANLFATKIIPGVAAVWDHLNKTIPEDSWMRKWDFGLLGYLAKLVDKLSFVDKIIDKIFGEGTSKKTPLADVGKAVDKALGTEQGGDVDQATGGAISNALGRTPVPEVGTPERPGYQPLYPHQGYTPPASGAGGGGIGAGGGDGGVDRGPNGPAYDVLKRQRQRFGNELNADPHLKEQLAALISLENEGAGTGVAESLMNRSNLTGSSLRQGIFGTPGIDRGRSFYGPVRSGLLESRVRELERHPERMRRLMNLIDQTLAGTNRIEGYTDQGSAGDPNYASGGVGININRERFNNYQYPGAREYRANQQRLVAEEIQRKQQDAQRAREAAAAPQSPGTEIGAGTSSASRPKKVDIVSTGGGPISRWLNQPYKLDDPGQPDVLGMKNSYPNSPLMDSIRQLQDASNPATSASVPPVGDSRWNGAPLSAVSTWGSGGSTSTTTNDNSRSAEANIGVMNIYSGSSTMVGVGQDAGNALVQNMAAGHANSGPQ